MGAIRGSFAGAQRIGTAVWGDSRIAPTKAEQRQSDAHHRTLTFLYNVIDPFQLAQQAFDLVEPV